MADETVVHIHNHSLGKNASLPGAISILARLGWGMLLHIHDFAEDFRPDNYQLLVQALAPGAPATLPHILYPQGDAIHYAVLNGRDRAILARAGVPAQQLHSLPNPVSIPTELPRRQQARVCLGQHLPISEHDRYVLYPVRGIRRKNLGELLLWGAAYSRSAHFGLTMPPLNPVEMPRYAAWKQLARELQLPVWFEVGLTKGLDYPGNLAAADLALTTSVAEGFGLVFLETWLAGLPLVGRNLPEITADFAAAGVQLNGLSNRVQIPLAWIDHEAFITELRESYARTLAAYHRPWPGDREFVRNVSQLLTDDLLDFGCCSA